MGYSNNFDMDSHKLRGLFHAADSPVPKLAALRMASPKQMDGGRPRQFSTGLFVSKPGRSWGRRQSHVPSTLGLKSVAPFAESFRDKQPWLGAFLASCGDHHSG